MSISIMTMVWQSDIPAGRKLVLLSLADNSNDRGECYPSIEAVATRCSLSVRAVQGHIADLEKSGFLSRDQRNGRSNLFTLHPRRICTPAESAPPQNLHPTPAESAPPPAESAPPTPAESAPITVIEPSLNRQLNQKSANARADVVAKAFGLSDVDGQVLADYLAHRKKRKADVTATVVADLREQAALASLSLTEAMRLCIRRGWTGFDAAWVNGAGQGGARGAAAGQQPPAESFADRKARKAAERFEEFSGRGPSAAGRAPLADVVDVQPVRIEQHAATATTTTNAARGIEGV